MKRIAVVIGICISFKYAINAQVVKQSLEPTSFYKKEINIQREPIPYQYVREADVMWTKTIWRIVDLRQKMNYPLYYPTEEIQERKSFVQLLVNAVKYNLINAYDPIDDEFTTRLSYNQLLKNFGAEDKEIPTKTPDGRDTVVIQKGQIRWGDVKELLIREQWFFDKQRSVMEVRIIGICPILHKLQILKTGGEEEPSGQIQRVQIFWVKFPEARKVLADVEVFNNFNDAQRITFDDLFWKRHFDSYIIRESNVWDNRLITDYTFTGLQTLLEGERIKTNIFNFEHDLWEY